MKRYIPLAIILVLIALFYFTGWYHIFSFQVLKENHQMIKQYVGQHPISAPFLYILAYILMTALTLPGGIILSLIGGYLFPQPWCTLFVVFGATIGATCLFLAAKTAFGDLLRKKAAPFLVKMKEGFQKNAASYMLFLRFVPLFPFWLVNLAPAFFNLRARTFIWTTALGIIPGSFAYTQAGAGLREILEVDEKFTLGAVLNIKLRIALIALGVIALIPIVIKKWKERRDRQ